ncbi:MAG: SIS domain-containing protein [Acidilobus sp.]
MLSAVNEGVLEMIKLYSTWPDQLISSYRSGLALKGPTVSPARLLLCGMGGSGATGDYIAAMAQSHDLKFPVIVHKADGVPSWVGKGDLVVAISYSGNTYETISCAREARERGALVASVTSGGKLGEWARSNGLPLVTIEPNYYPRTALGMLVGASLGILNSLGVNIADDAEVEAAARALRSTSNVEGEAIARALGSRDLYIVAGCGPYEIVAHRWRQEFSENAKAITKTEFYPESAHNDLVVWQTSHDVRKGFVLIEGGGALCSVLVALLKEVYSEQGDAIVRVAPRGEGLLAQLLQGSLLGGYVSVYLARLIGVDPRGTQITARYKKAIEEAGLS